MFTELDIKDNPILAYFHYAHLPNNLREISKPFCHLAATILLNIKPSAERTVAFRKLLESKDAAVRAALP